MPLSISSQFDSGAIDVLRCTDDGQIDLHIKADTHAEFRQWFHFRLSGARDVNCQLRFLNAGECTYTKGWQDYNIVASYDKVHWFRIPTDFDGKVLSLRFTPAWDNIYFAYFEPYSWERHLGLIARATTSGLANVTRLAVTLDGHDLDCLQLGKGATTVWMIARQHPGETMAEWYVEGFLERLMNPLDATAAALLAACNFHIVPNMNPDGSVRGHLRTNAAGMNLNREWMQPTREFSPEVYWVKKAIEAVPPAIFLDIHGDEALPYNFIAGCEMVPNFTSRQAAMQREFIVNYERATPDFQSVHGYPEGHYRDEALKLASKYVGHTYGGLSVTLEMPFKDNADFPMPEVGWNGERAKALGAAVLTPLLQSVRSL